MILYKMQLRTIIPCIALVLSAIPRTDCFYVERLSSVIQPQCNREIQRSRTLTKNNAHTTFYLQSDSFDESVLSGNP